MRKHLFQVLFVIFTLNYFPFAEACWSSKDVEKPVVKEIVRNVTTLTSHCTCGMDKVNKDNFDFDNGTLSLSWTVFIHLKTQFGDRTCSGTIINSNMIVTSHKCLMKNNQITISNPSVQTHLVTPILADKDDVQVTTHLNKNDPLSREIPIDLIIYHKKFSEDLQKGLNASEHDVAVLITNNYNFAINNLNLTPICVPRYGDIPTQRMLNKDAHFKSVRGWDDQPDKYYVGGNPFSEIYSAKRCNHLSKLNINSGNNETICIPYTLIGPNVEGGALLLKQTSYLDDSRTTTYLVGINSWIDHSKKNAHHKYAYFTNINSIVQYIEEIALTHKSEWCPTPPYSNEISWPWELTDPDEAVDESLDCECGLKGEPIDGKVTGGVPAIPHEFPWMVKIWYQPGSQPEFCGGSLINDRMILTAASCITDPRIFPYIRGKLTHINSPKYLKAFYVYVGGHTTEGDNENGEYIEVHEERIIFHPGYPGELNEEAYDFDIAIIILKNPVNFKLTTVGQICLPSTNNLKWILEQNLSGIIAGWGKSAVTNDYLNAGLQKITSPIYSPYKCIDLEREFHQGRVNDTKIKYQTPTNTVICTGNLNSYVDTVYDGDKGDPLMVEMTPGRFTQMGIVSTFELQIDQVDPATLKTAVPTYCSNVEAFLSFIKYHFKMYGGKGCKQPKDNVGKKSRLNELFI